MYWIDILSENKKLRINISNEYTSNLVSALALDNAKESDAIKDMDREIVT